MLLRELLENSAQRLPEQTALIFRDQPITYAQLSEQTRRLAAGYAALGVEAGDRVALLLPNSPAFIMGYYAAAYLGAVSVPANPMLKPPELAYRSEERRVGKECRSRCDWSSDVCSSDLPT